MGFGLLHDQVPPLSAPSKPLLFRLDCAHVIQFCQAIDHFLALPNHSDLAKYRITRQEWVVMQDLEVILSVRRDMHFLYVL